MPFDLTSNALIAIGIIAVAVIAGYLWWAWSEKFFPFG